MSSHGTSAVQTYILLVKGNIGPGCLALPFVLSMLGPFISLPVLGIVGFFCVYNMWLLVECKKSFVEVKTYGEMGLAAFGRRGEVLVEVFLSMMQLSICCVYYTFIANSLSPIIALSPSLITLLLIPFFVVITQLRHMRHLAPLSLYAGVCLFVALVMIFGLCISRLDEVGMAILPQAQSSKFIVFLVSTVYAFEGIGVVLPIEAAMQTPEKFGIVLTTAMITVTVVYVMFAELVVFAFGYVDDAGVTAFLLRQGAVSTTLSSSISVLISLAVFLSYPLQLYPALQVVEIYAGYKHVAEVLVADAEPVVENVLNPKILRRLNVVTGDSPIYKRNPFEKKRLLHSMISMRTLSAARTPPTMTASPTIGLTPRSDMSSGCNLMRTQSLDSIDTFTNSPHHSPSAAATAAGYHAVPTSELRDASVTPTMPQFVIRLALVLGTGLLAAIIPNVGLLVSLAGASSGATLALILPSLIDLYTTKDLSMLRYGLNCVSIFLGVVGAIAGTYLSVVDITQQVFMT